MKQTCFGCGFLFVYLIEREYCFNCRPRRSDEPLSITFYYRSKESKRVYKLISGDPDKLIVFHIHKPSPVDNKPEGYPVAFSRWPKHFLLCDPEGNLI